uniref:Uncharacterized protein n=2 Tax=Anguilla anguilla TaxID=7936 RepID=A0A0E9PTU6_ANGAN
MWASARGYSRMLAADLLLTSSVLMALGSRMKTGSKSQSEKSMSAAGCSVFN